jgi:hypothetical protein
MLARVLSGLAVLLFALPVLADNVESVDAKGKPREFKTGLGKIAIWYDNDAWHFRATANKANQTFTGKIEAVDGQVVGMKVIALTAKNPRATGGGLLAVKKDSLDVNYKLLKDSESGYDFQVDDKTSAIKFSLKVDDGDATELILIGPKGTHPKSSEFSLSAKKK